MEKYVHARIGTQEICTYISECMYICRCISIHFMKHDEFSSAIDRRQSDRICTHFRSVSTSPGCPGIVCYIFTGRQPLPSAVTERVGGAAGPHGFHGGVVTRGAAAWLCRRFQGRFTGFFPCIWRKNLGVPGARRFSDKPIH